MHLAASIFHSRWITKEHIQVVICNCGGWEGGRGRRRTVVPASVLQFDLQGGRHFQSLGFGRGRVVRRASIAHN